jgi:hypothetical protein
MPWNVIADEQLKVVFLALSGHLTAADMVALHSNLFARFGRRNFGVFVHIEAAKFAIDIDALGQLAHLEPVFNRIAIYAPSPAAQELCRRWAQVSSLLHGNRRIEAFDTTVSAFEWLMAPELPADQPC